MQRQNPVGNTDGSRQPRNNRDGPKATPPGPVLLLLFLLSLKLLALRTQHDSLIAHHDPGLRSHTSTAVFICRKRAPEDAGAAYTDDSARLLLCEHDPLHRYLLKTQNLVVCSHSERSEPLARESTRAEWSPSIRLMEQTKGNKKSRSLISTPRCPLPPKYHLHAIRQTSRLPLRHHARRTCRRIRHDPH